MKKGIREHVLNKCEETKKREKLGGTNAGRKNDYNKNKIDKRANK